MDWSHRERCRATVLAHADDLAEAVRAGRLNASNISNLINGFLDAPAYWDHDKKWLHDLAYERIMGRKP